MKDQKSRVEPRRVITCGHELPESTKKLPQIELKSTSFYFTKWNAKNIKQSSEAFFETFVFSMTYSKAAFIREDK